MGVVRHAWMFGVVLLTACLVTGVRGEMTQSALIATGSVVGVMVVSALIGLVIYCTVRQSNRKTKKESLPSSITPTTPNHHTLPRAPPPPSIHHPHHPSPRPLSFVTPPPQPLPPGAKAHYYTQHAGPQSRHRPPLAFYTVRRDPRDGGDVLTMPAVGPGMGGRPVLYLDMLGSLRSPMMYQKNGTLTRTVNGSAGGILIRDLDSADDRNSQEGRYRKKDRKQSEKHSRGRTKSGTRSDSPTTASTSSRKQRSRSRSQEAVSRGKERDSRSRSRSRSRHSSHGTEEVLARPGDIILSDSHGPDPREDNPIIDNLVHVTRNSVYKDKDKKAEGEGILIEGLQQKSYSLTAEEKRQQYAEYETMDRDDLAPYSITAGPLATGLDTPLADYSTSNPTLSQAEPVAPLQVPDVAVDAGFPSAQVDPEPEPEPTPRADYPVSPRVPPSPPLEPKEPELHLQPTPREDYSLPRDSSANDMFRFSQVVESYSPSLNQPQHRDTGDVSNSFDDILNSVNFNDLPRGSASLRQRPPSPPFDGEISPRNSVYPPRGSSQRQRPQHSVDGRVPTPPPATTEAYGDNDTGEVVRTLQGAPRPPTPPPGRKILPPTESEMAVLRDLQAEGGGAAAGGRVKQPQSPAANKPALPFMAELRRRYGDSEEDDGGAVAEDGHQQYSLESMQQRGEDILRGLDAVLYPEGLPHSRSHVSFASEPPEIIPGSSTTLPPDYDNDSPVTSPPSAQEAAPPPPPPPPPLAPSLLM